MENDDHVKYVNECIKLIKDSSGKQIFIDLTEYHRPQKISDPATGFIVPNIRSRGSIRIPLNETILRNGTTEQWVYYESVKKFGTVEKFHPRYEDVNDTKTFHGASANYEKMFFMVFISPRCEKVNIKPIRERQNPNPYNKPASFRLLLPEVEAQQAVEFGKKSALVANKIYNELKYPQLRMIASGTFKITGTDTMGENMLRKVVAQKATENPENMELFLRDSNANPYVELMATINRAIEKNLIRKTNQLGRLRFCYNKPDGKMGDEICPIAKGGTPDQERESLYEFYKTRNSDYEFLQKKVAELDQE
jgi:hypothetical protein